MLVAAVASCPPLCLLRPSHDPFVLQREHCPKNLLFKASSKMTTTITTRTVRMTSTQASLILNCSSTALTRPTRWGFSTMQLSSHVLICVNSLSKTLPRVPNSSWDRKFKTGSCSPEPFPPRCSWRFAMRSPVCCAGPTCW